MTTGGSFSGGMTSTFTVKLDDQTSAPAGDAVGALEALRAKLTDDTKALREMQTALSRLRGNTAGTAKAMSELKDRIAAQKATIANTQQAFIELGGTFGSSSNAADDHAETLGHVLEALQRGPGAIGDLGTVLAAVRGRLAAFVKAFGPLGVMFLATAAVGVGVVAVLGRIGSAAIDAATSVARFAVSTADARRSELLHLEALHLLPRAFGGIAGGARAMQGEIDRVSRATGLARDRIGAFAQQLGRARVGGQAFGEVLGAAATAAAAGGEEYGRHVLQMGVMSARAGRDVHRFAEDIRRRFGGVVNQQLSSLTSQSEQLQASFAELFADLRIDGLLSGLRQVTQLFSQNTTTGRALRAVFTAVFQPIIDAVTTALPLVRAFFQGVMVRAVQFGNAVHRLGVAFSQAFGDSSLFSGSSDFFSSFAFFLGQNLLGAFVSELEKVVDIVTGFFLLIGDARRWVEQWSGIGTSLVDGLIGGMTSAFGRAQTYMREMGDSLRERFASVLEIRSPSRVFARLGAEIPAGIAEGVDDGAPRAARAVEDVVRMPRPSGLGGPSSAGAGTPITISVVINAASASASDIARDIEAELVPVFERLALSIGGLPA